MIIFLFLFLCGCFESASTQDFQWAQKEMEAGRIREAQSVFERIFERSSDRKLIIASSEKLYEISFLHTKDYKKAIRYLDVLVSNAETFQQSFEALKKKAFIQHKYLSHYEDAIATYHRILASRRLNQDDENEIRRNLVKCLFAINNLTQARIELAPLKDARQPTDVQTAAKLLEASSLQTEGQTEKAIAAYQDLLLNAQNEEHKKEALINLALCYEQKEQYKEALAAIDKITNRDAVLTGKRSQLERLVKFQGRRLKR